MPTVYNMLKPSSIPQKGLVEVFNLKGNEYGVVAVDGKLIHSFSKHDSFLSGGMVKRSFIAQYVKASGVKEDKLTFIYCDFEEFAHSVLSNTNQYYDANNYFSYQPIFHLIKKNPQVIFKPHELEIMAVGVADLEEYFEE